MGIPIPMAGYFSLCWSRIFYNVVVNLVVVNGKKSVKGFDTPLCLVPKYYPLLFL